MSPDLEATLRAGLAGDVAAYDAAYERLTERERQTLTEWVHVVRLVGVSRTLAAVERETRGGQ